MQFVERLIFNFTLLLMPRYIIKKFPRSIHAETFLFVFQPLILFNGESNLINLFRALTRQLPHSGGLIRDNPQP